MCSHRPFWKVTGPNIQNSLVIANYSGHVHGSNTLNSGHFDESGNLTIFKTAARERNNIIIVIISFCYLQNIRHYNFKLSSFWGNLYIAPDNKSPEIDG